VRFDGEEDKRTYYFKEADVVRWVAAANAAGMNDRESDSEEEAGFDSFEIDLGAPSPDAPRSRRRGKGGEAAEATLGTAKAAATTTRGTTASSRPRSSLFPGGPNPSSASPKRTASLNELVSGGGGGGGAGRGGGGDGGGGGGGGGGGASSNDTRAATRPLAPRRQKKGPPSPSPLGFLVVPLLATLAALGAFAVSWLVLQRIPEPQRVLRFRVPW